MTYSLDDLLKALPQPRLDYPLDQLEPAVWARIGSRRAAAAWPGASLRFQLAAAAVALVIGMALGMATNITRGPDRNQSLLYASYVESGPMARLESGL